MKRATIKDVATLSGLSICTVSRALRGLPKVSPVAQAKVEDAAEKLGYRPSAAASRLRGGRTGAVAIVVPTATTWYFSQAAEAAEEIIADGGLDPMLVSLRGQEEVQSRIFDDPADLAQKVDGLLMIDVDLTPHQTAALSASGLEVASVGMHDVPWDNVGIDNVAAAQEATNKLLALGHWDIAFLAGTQTGNGKTRATDERRQGFELALAEHDAVPHPDWVVEAGYTVEGGRQAMSELIRHRGNLPTAVFAGCDEVAFGALMALKEHGLSCPEDISLIGIDDHPMSWVLGLTTIGQPVADEAAFAATLLLERLQKPDEAGSPANHLLPTVLAERTTTRRHRG
ncbi:LacI family DNA-binding transcriptional regulator [Arthrobacter sp. B10-11]|uniref:LacI family DNA-binding transcriptional regulator n=1 Tax=Arthrobacter sp. B10-11 TaxID=3081160 RepID=UPI002953A417|nr:LacI family DNA-binding transcriptional regulator [Arthrobacter sp. B10-11]MDV8146944.1 LacI family DNA-binding transcriptional regulator [Arthrobacter sp. B10-11]